MSFSFLTDEAVAVETLSQELPWTEARSRAVKGRAVDLVEKARAVPRKTAGELESFLRVYGLETHEGLALMALAEAFLRIPDPATADALIADKIADTDWLMDTDKADDWMVRATGMGLRMTRRTLQSVFHRLGKPVIRRAVKRAMRMMGRQFVIGRTIEEAVRNAAPYRAAGYRPSYDMLGEGARTEEDAARYFESYDRALDYIGTHIPRRDLNRPGMSVKLSALHPRYEYAHRDTCIPFMEERLQALCRKAAGYNVALTVDAEESWRLDLSLQIIETVLADSQTKDWRGFGLAVQAYDKRCLPLIDHLEEQAIRHDRRINVRLVKGAYWDTEIKRAQILGLSNYPVFTRKANTDLSWIACAHRLLEKRKHLYALFATHNAHSVAAVLEMAGPDPRGFEFQRLHGMGGALHDTLLREGLAAGGLYAPVGTHEDLLPYLVRRLLENGANTSFVHQLSNPDVPAGRLALDPVIRVRDRVWTEHRHPAIPLPVDLYRTGTTTDRKNSTGLDLGSDSDAQALLAAMKKAMDGKNLVAQPLLSGKSETKAGTAVPILNPADPNRAVGELWAATPAQIEKAFRVTSKGFESWRRTPARKRAVILETLADLLEENRALLMGLLVEEAGKTIPDALAEIREAVDFCRYYAAQGRRLFGTDGQIMDGPTGEHNVLTLDGRGVFVCISPWNFPLAIFLGQIAAALMAGNAVIAKPAEQTPLIAAATTKLILKAGLPADALALLPGDGTVGAQIVAHPAVAGVAFTGSTAVARLINRTLAAKDGPIVPLIAETGGQNAMIVDSSALPEQIVDDVILSALGSAGQRCSALRVLYVQNESADRLIAMLKGAMATRRVGNPAHLNNDIGPVIDPSARETLVKHRSYLDTIGRLIGDIPVPETIKGYFFTPCAYEIDSIDRLEEEVFGPILHVIRYDAADLDRVVAAINATGYGLTFGVHSRIGGRMATLAAQSGAGNVYINRGMTGAVVGCQPFGGQGLSGTGPKAGGPHYLSRFATEKLVSTDTTRQGGNMALVSLGD
ncbi:MAG: bifunctional proline dehydrogenase/L-glutamate gamma-semialdehyde dehydrogenase PutA [Alphaproteobacteria bacterium]|nr:bifunctional proline dehydrogenase/L-glutamate gamma-semialdehyde dehydrogenase PutA [Alphaproteobacteria bacterium]